jgi:hypothetical protein
MSEVYLRLHAGDQTWNSLHILSLAFILGDRD